MVEFLPSLLEIGEECFGNCQRFGYVGFGENPSLVRIEKFAFYRCSA